MPYDKPKGPVGGNQTQGAGELPAKVSVPLPGVGSGGQMEPCKPGSKVKSPQGFSSGIIPGKI